MATEAFTVRAESDIVHQLDHLADSLDRSRNYLVKRSGNTWSITPGRSKKSPMA